MAIGGIALLDKHPEFRRFAVVVDARPRRWAKALTDHGGPIWPMDVTVPISIPNSSVLVHSVAVGVGARSASSVSSRIPLASEPWWARKRPRSRLFGAAIERIGVPLNIGPAVGKDQGGLVAEGLVQVAGQVGVEDSIGFLGRVLRRRLLRHRAFLRLASARERGMVAATGMLRVGLDDQPNLFLLGRVRDQVDGIGRALGEPANALCRLAQGGGEADQAHGMGAVPHDAGEETLHMGATFRADEGVQFIDDHELQPGKEVGKVLGMIDQ